MSSIIADRAPRRSRGQRKRDEENPLYRIFAGCCHLLVTTGA